MNWTKSPLKSTVVLLIFILGPMAFAEITGKIVEVDEANNEVAISTNSRLVREGDVFTFKNSGADNECLFTVEAVNGNTLIVSYEDCPIKLKEGQEMVKSALKSRKTDKRPPSPRQTHFENKDESWYTLWGFGLTSNRYNSEAQAAVDVLNSDVDYYRISLALDLLGFYWPFSNRQTMMGFIINSTGDSWTSTKNTYSRLSLSHYLYALSTHHFFNSNIGEGWFARADVGLTRAVGSVYTNSTNYTYTSDSGFGYLVGGGYSWPFPNGDARVNLSLLISQKKSGDLKSQSFSLVTGFLF